MGRALCTQEHCLPGRLPLWESNPSLQYRHAGYTNATLHIGQVVHFDLKPDNLLLDGPLISHPGYAAPSVKVADFGLSKHKWSNYVSGVRDLRWARSPAAPGLPLPRACAFARH